MKYTANTLKKMELLLKETGYQMRSGKGNFNTGYCILEHKKVVVVNKYHSLEARINALIDILNRLTINEKDLSDSSLKWYKAISKISLNKSK